MNQISVTDIRFKAGIGLGRYLVLVDRHVVGEVRKVELYGYTYWCQIGNSYRFNTREEAALQMVRDLELASDALSRAYETGMGIDCLSFVARAGDLLVVLIDTEGPGQHEGMHPDDCEREAPTKVTVNVRNLEVVQ